jgi:enoyl-CoA hydratase/carnithine racemase
MAADPVLVDIRPPLATVTLNRPEKHNAFDVALVTALDEAAQRVGAEPDVQVVIVRGNGRSFSSGLDLDMFAAEGMAPEFFAHEEAAFRRFETMDKTVIAAIHGHCLGGGVQLAAACDIRVASADADLGLPAIDEGLFPGLAPYRLPRLVGRGRAAELILTGRRVDGREALAIGLADHVVANLEAELDAIVATYVRAPRAAAAASKRLMALSYDAPFEEVLAESERLLAECLGAPEVARAQAAWRARRR